MQEPTAHVAGIKFTVDHTADNSVTNTDGNGCSIRMLSFDHGPYLESSLKLPIPFSLASKSLAVLWLLNSLSRSPCACVLWHLAVHSYSPTRITANPGQKPYTPRCRPTS